MNKIYLKDTETLWQKADWYRAVPLTERLASLQASRDAQHEKNAWINEKAEKIFQQWKTQAPYNKDFPFADRLASDSLTENDLLHLLAEPLETLQARLPVPDWLAELSSAFETFSVSNKCPLSVMALDKSKPTQAFLNAIHPLITRGIQRLVSSMSDLAGKYSHLPFDQQTVVSFLFESLSLQLLPKLRRTLVLELNVARALGHLQGDTPEKRFESFVQQLAVPEKSLPLLKEYAVLTRQCVVSIDQWVTFSLELVSHLCADWQQICATFTPEADPGQISAIHVGSGDTHRGGRSVTILRFSSGFKLVYKPRSLAIDLHFQELLLWLNERGSHPPFQIFSILNRRTYGWSAFIESQECQSEMEVQRFYERQGAYLALLYILDATDLHAENIIAVGEYPLLIDLEALFQPHDEMAHQLHGKDPASVALDHSVMRVGLLPHYLWGNNDVGGINMSGLGGEEGQLVPRAVPKWEDIGTDQMHLVYAQAEMATSKNRPILKGQPVDVRNYRDNILTGFDKMYRTLLQNRKTLLDEMLPRFALDEIRFIARPTDIYARFLYDSFRPELLRDALERERHFDRLWVGIAWQPHIARIIPAERADLLRGDIPLFTTHPNSLDLFTSQGEAMPNFFQQTSMNRVRERIQRLDTQDCTRQRWIINASLAGVSTSPLPLYTRMEPVQPQQPEIRHARWLDVAQAIGDELCQRAIRDKASAGWLGVSQVKEQEWEVRAARLDLYNGLPGITLFLAHLAELTGKSRYLETARAALHNIQVLLQHSRRQQLLPCIGAFEGWGGLIGLFTRLGTLWNEPALFEEAEEIVSLLRDLIEQDASFDIMAGSAGCIVALLRLHAVAPSRHTLDLAIACGDHLLAHACSMQTGIGWKASRQTVPLTGMAHGNAGIAFSLLKLADSSGAERFRQAALEALAYERSLFSPEQQNWPDLRKRKHNNLLDQLDLEKDEHFMVAWCHGASGIALARLACPRAFAEKMTREEIEYALATTVVASQREGFDPTLCHGIAGWLDTLLTARQVLERDDYTPHVERLAHWLQALWDERKSQEESQGTLWWMQSPGFMMGIAGIGYTFLRLADPSRVPSVLTPM